MKLMYKSLLALSFTAAIVAAPKVVSAAELDCTGATNGCNDVFANALWITVDQQSTGTGVIDSFVRIQGNDLVVDGHNTDFRPLANDENNSPNFTRDLQIKNIPILTIDPPGPTGPTAYYEFLLDINQLANDALLSLHEVQICTSAAGDQVATGTCPGALVYDLDAGADNNVLLDYNLNSGSGSGDLFLYIPVSVLGVNPETYVYLYSAFGLPAPNGNNDGFEEWAIRICEDIVGATCTNEELPEVPEPASVMLLGTGLLGLAAAIRRRRRAV